MLFRISLTNKFILSWQMDENHTGNVSHSGQPGDEELMSQLKSEIALLDSEIQELKEELMIIHMQRKISPSVQGEGSP